MIYPKFLKKGDKIGVPAPSSGAYDELYINRYKNAKKKLENMGYNIEWSKNIFTSINARSADAKYRAEEFQKMIEDDSIKYIICAAGGEFLVEILPYLKLESILKHPKIIQGFSDPTGVLYQVTTKYDIATIYGLNFGDYGAEEYTRDITDNLKIISGNIIKQQNYDMYQNEREERITGLEGYNFTNKVEWKCLNTNKVEVTGRIIGGCLDLISELSGTKYDATKEFIERYKSEGIIWYFDNCDFGPEELIRTLWKFNELGYFEHTNAVIFGRNGNEFTSYIGYTMETALEESVIANMGFPIIFDADISHKGPCFTIINGATATVCYEEGKANIEHILN